MSYWRDYNRGTPGTFGGEDAWIDRGRQQGAAAGAHPRSGSRSRKARTRPRGFFGVIALVVKASVLALVALVFGLFVYANL